MDYVTSTPNRMPSLIHFLISSWRIVVWLVLSGFAMSWFIWRDCCSSISSYFSIGTFTASLWIALWLGNNYVSQVISYFFSWHKEPITRLVAGLVGMVVYTLGIVYLLLIVFESFFGFEVGDRLDFTFLSTISITLVISMFMTGRSFLSSWRQSAIDAERLQKESVKAQYESLKNQVNPHFLFNSLNALTNLVYQDPDKAAKFIKQLSEVYRYVLDSRDKEVVSLQEELNFLQSYIFLQQIRYGDKLKMEVDIPSPAGQVAPLALQLLIENAIKHNVIAEEHPLAIRIFINDGFIVVENNLQKKSILTEGTSGLGLENIKRRYEFLSTEKVRVEEGHSSFKVSVPILKSLK